MALLTSAASRIAAAVVGLVLASTPLAAQAPDESLEYGVKAAYLLNFSRYVQWPEDTTVSAPAPLVICIHGSNPFGDQLERTVRGRTSGGRPIAVRHTESIAEARACQVVFMSQAEWRRRPDVLAALARHGVLTVGETAAFAEGGGIISFVIEHQVVRFTVNLSAAEKAGLRLSSRMLAIATRLYGEQGASQK